MRTALLLSGLLLTLAASGPALAQGRPGPDTAPQQGSPAPNFPLHRLGKDGAPAKETVTLHELSPKRPVALVFGSYT